MEKILEDEGSLGGTYASLGEYVNDTYNAYYERFLGVVQHYLNGNPYINSDDFYLDLDFVKYSSRVVISILSEVVIPFLFPENVND